MRAELGARLMRRALAVGERFVGGDTRLGDAAILLYEVVLQAAVYWDAPGLDPDDFCVQHVGLDALVFGGRNRLVWSPAYGYRPDRRDCTAAFLARCDALGPLPGMRRAAPAAPSSSTPPA